MLAQTALVLESMWNEIISDGGFYLANENNNYYHQQRGSLLSNYYVPNINDNKNIRGPSRNLF